MVFYGQMNPATSHVHYFNNIPPTQSEMKVFHFSRKSSIDYKHVKNGHMCGDKLKLLEGFKHLELKVFPRAEICTQELRFPLSFLANHDIFFCFLSSLSRTSNPVSRSFTSRDSYTQPPGGTSRCAASVLKLQSYFSWSLACVSRGLTDALV